jgi:methylmalonyl-CoA/ethylmalonyl-CoA epimerase
LPLVFHHIGIACLPEHFARGKEREELGLLGYSPEGKEWTDERLGMKGQFLIAAHTGAPRMELVAPHGNSSPVTSWLERGVKLYHVAYLVENLSAEIERMRKNRAKMMLAPTPAVAFGGRNIAFLVMPNRLLIELIEKA